MNQAKKIYNDGCFLRSNDDNKHILGFILTPDEVKLVCRMLAIFERYDYGVKPDTKEFKDLSTKFNYLEGFNLFNCYFKTKTIVRWFSENGEKSY